MGIQNWANQFNGVLTDMLKIYNKYAFLAKKVHMWICLHTIYA